MTKPARSHRAGMGVSQRSVQRSIVRLREQGFIGRGEDTREGERFDVNPLLERLLPYYLAQGCLACTVILAPHQIVLGADHDPSDRLLEKTANAFGRFLSRRVGDAQPLFRYKQLERSGFIAAPTPIPALAPLGGGPRVTGAVGMCVAAARAERG